MSEPDAALAAEAIVLTEAWRVGGEPPEALTQAAVTAARAELASPSDRAAAVVFADDALLRELNRTHRDADRPTNVLAFPAAPSVGPAEPPAGLGDIVLALETIAREAEDLGMSRDARTLHMIVHGYFHLHGYDHKAEDDAEEMESMERRSLARLGLADPYLDPDDA